MTVIVAGALVSFSSLFERADDDRFLVLRLPASVGLLGRLLSGRLRCGGCGGGLLRRLRRGANEGAAVTAATVASRATRHTDFIHAPLNPTAAGRTHTIPRLNPCGTLAAANEKS